MDSPAKVGAQQSVKRVFSLFDEFKKFAFKGNMLDLAIAVVIGGAFGKLVDSFVKNIVMPTIAYFASDTTPYTALKIPPGADNGVPVGLFLGEFANFLIVSFAVFVFMVKLLGFLRKKEEPAPPSKSEQLLTEIRDLLNKPV